MASVTAAGLMAHSGAGSAPRTDERTVSSAVVLAMILLAAFAVAGGALFSASGGATRPGGTHGAPLAMSR